MDVSLESDTPQNCESSLFWLISFLLALALAGTFLLICCCLLGGRYYKEQTRNNVENFVQCLKHQAELWKQERERWEAEFKLRLEEQKHKNAAWDQNLELRGDMDDVMEENRVLRDQKDTLNRRNEQLEQENKHVGMENAGLKARLAQVGQLGHEADPESELELEPQPEPEPEPEPERSRNTAGFSSTLFNSGLPPGSNLSLEEAVERDLDSPVSHASFPSTWSDSDPGTTPRPGLPRSPPGNEQDPGTSDEMMTSRDLLSSPKKRNTWAPHSESPSHPPEDDKWKPVTPTKHRSSVG
ncbi:hypothetical protein N0V84_006990 [Fusarium piperis]|uniref:Uncharacterized protein n=1 Tax=Fusarium piperis TaxID=1435070 RepID=A0A9W8WAT1_9HYPO|nr:hypothetical protein N0V84_006990 [Fusarium piperis]